MKIYEVEITGTCLSSITLSYPIEANSIDEAKAHAKEEFKADMEKRNDVTEMLGVEFGYIGVLKQ